MKNNTVDDAFEALSRPKDIASKFEALSLSVPKMAQVAIEMTLPVYDGLIDKCAQSSREYAVLKNGVIVHRPKDDRFERILEIDCDSGEANRLLALATKIYPDAVADISKGIATSIKKPPKPVD